MRPAELRALIFNLQGEEAWMTCLKKDVALPILERALTSPGTLPLSSILCTAVLGQSINGYDAAGAMRGTPINDSDRLDHSNWAWPLETIEILVPYMPAKGAQGFWNWHPSC